jgi:hypothetical protein
MSEQGQPIEETKPVTEQEGDIPETVVPAEPVVEPTPEPEAPPAEAKTQAAPATVKKPWFQQRIDELTRQKNEEKRARETAEAKAAVLEAQARPADDPTAPKPTMTQEAFDAAVKSEARRVASVEAQQAREARVGDAGIKEYGLEAFTERCNMVAALGATERPEFMQIMADPDIIPDGHKVIVALAEHPEEAQRILSLEPVKMAAALSRFATTAQPKETPLSKAPAPIKPIGGSAKPSVPAENDDIKTWMAKRNATARTTAGGKPVH